MHPLAKLEFSNRVAKRAQYEALDLSIHGEDILVRNESHANPKEHEYTVTIEAGVPRACTCPADARFEGACKHRVAVAIQRPLCDTVQQVKDGEPPVAADGGHPTSNAPSETEVLEVESEPKIASTVHPDPKTDCEECLADFPCWECYRTGRVDIE